MANVLSGLGGGMVGYHSNSLTLLANRGGAIGRLVALITGATSAVTLLAGASFVALTPRPLIGGVLVFLGLSLLVEWVYDSRRRLPPADYGIVILILVVIAALGFLPGVAVGTVAAVILFAVSYSRNDVVKHALSGRAYQSKLDRPRCQVELLRHHGDDIFILELQGYMFFGTADGLLQRIASRCASTGVRSLRFLVLDFPQVSGLDSSAANSFRQARRIASTKGFTVVFTGVTPRVGRLLGTNGVAEAEELKRFADLDHGLEWCVDRVIEGAGLPLDDGGDDPQWAIELEALLGHMPRVEVPAGHVLMREGDPPDDLYILATGRLTAAVAEAKDSEESGCAPWGPARWSAKSPCTWGHPARRRSPAIHRARCTRSHGLRSTGSKPTTRRRPPPSTASSPPLSPAAWPTHSARSTWCSVRRHPPPPYSCAKPVDTRRTDHGVRSRQSH